MSILRVKAHIKNKVGEAMKRFYVLIIGIIIIVVGFVNFVHITPWPKQSWIDLITVILVYTACCTAGFRLWQTVPQFQNKIPSFGILWFSIATYSFCSLAALVVAHFAVWDFSLSLIVQLSIVFIFSVFVLAAFKADDKAKNIKRTENKTLGAIDELRSLYTKELSAAAILEPKHKELRKEIEKIGEDLRYISAIPGKNAGDLEDKIYAELKNLFNILKNIDNTESAVQLQQIKISVKLIRDLIRIRKECKNNQDLQEMI